MPRPHSLIIVSAVGTSVAGLLPAICTPNIVSDGCRLTKDHSSLEPERKDVARPTDRLLSVSPGNSLLGDENTHFLRKLCQLQVKRKAV